MKLENIIKVAWNERSKKYGKKIEGVLPKSLDPLINDYLDKWMFETIERYVEDDKKLKAITPKITCSKRLKLNNWPAKVMAAKRATFLIHCLGLSNLSI